MPAARNQEVTARRPLAKRMPQSSRGRRAAGGPCSQGARSAKALVSEAGRWEDGTAGSWTRDPVVKGHRVGGPASAHLPTASTSKTLQIIKGFWRSLEEADP